MNLLDTFFPDTGDALAHVETLTPLERHQLRTELHVLWLTTDLELARTETRRSELLAEGERARADLIAVEQERAGYQATIDRLEQIRTLLER